MLQNYQGNDCSERTCYFGIAHVDSPKGDLNADGLVSGALTTVVTGSEVYPWGTTEQFPNTDANEGHFYMECSNKGICDRKSGECDCFDGYTGTACSRAACPNDCSGHGTCESIKELAEMRSYDTNEHDVATTRVAGTNNHHGYDSSIEESYSYNLWDQDKTMGCKCDPVYYGADCSLKKCKYGVDPLFYDHEGVIRQTTVVHVGSGGKSKGDLSGSFKIVFYDVFGEKYVTKTINAKGATAADVKLALQALPNGVIAKNNQDVTAEQPNAVSVSAQKTTPGRSTRSRSRPTPASSSPSKSTHATSTTRAARTTGWPTHAKASSHRATRPTWAASRCSCTVPSTCTPTPTSPLRARTSFKTPLTWSRSADRSSALSQPQLTSSSWTSRTSVPAS